MSKEPNENIRGFSQMAILCIGVFVYTGLFPSQCENMNPPPEPDQPQAPAATHLDGVLVQQNPAQQNGIRL